MFGFAFAANRCLTLLMLAFAAAACKGVPYISSTQLRELRSLARYF